MRRDMPPVRSGLSGGLWCALAAWGGMALAHEVTQPAAVWFGAALAMALAYTGAAWRVGVRTGDDAGASSAPGGRARGVLLVLGCASVLLLAGGWFTVRTTPGPGDRWPAGDERVLMGVEGEIVEQPERGLAQGGALASSSRFNPEVTRTMLRVQRVRTDGGWHALGGTGGVVWLSVGGGETGLGLGDVVRLTGWARGHGAPANPGEPSFAAWHADRGILGSVSVAGPDLIERLETGGGGAVGVVRRWVAQVRTRALASVRAEDDGDGRASAVLEALLLGERSGAAGDRLSRSFAAAGVGHVLAISGLHVGLVVVMAVMAVRLTGDRPRLELIAAIGVVVLMLVLVPARPPIVRAALLCGALAAGRLGSRRYDAQQVLGLVAIAMLAWRPSDAMNPGFQLSFGVVAALLTVGGPLQQRLDGALRAHAERRLGWFVGAGVRWVGSALLVSVVAWMASAPIALAHFGAVAPVGPIATVAVLPLVALVLLLGYGGLLVVAVLGGEGAIGRSALEPASWAAEWLAAAAGWFESWPGAMVVLPGVGALCAAALFASLWLVMYRAVRFERVFFGPRLRLGGVGACVLLAGVMVWAGASVARSAAFPRDVALRVDTLAVGDGACHIVRTRGGVVMVDCGAGWLGAGRRMVPSAVRALGVRRVDRVIVTHADIDHFGALADAAGQMGVRELLVHDHFVERAEAWPGGAEAVLLRELRRGGVRVETISAGDELALGDGVLRVLHPEPGFRGDLDNENSLVLQAAVETAAGRRSALLTGDATARAIAGAEARLDASAPVLIATVPHHGSADDDALRLLRAVLAGPHGPGVAVQSTGPGRIDPPAWRPLVDEIGAANWDSTAVIGQVRTEILRDGSVRSRGYLE